MTGIYIDLKVKWFKSALLCLLLLFVSGGAIAQQTYLTHKLWKGGEARFEGRYRSKVFVYAPSKPSEKAPAVIVLPGGSYTYLAINSEGHDVAKYFVSKGFRAVVLRYRMGFYGAKYPQQLEDYRKAVDYIKDNSDRLGIDTTKIGVVGFSAGGHLAGCAALEENPRYRPAFVAMIYPVVTMKEPYVHKPSRDHLLRGNLSLIEKLSLEGNVNEDFPPVFLLHCEDDPVVRIEGSRAFASELKKKGVNCIVEIHPTGKHGFGLKPAAGSGAAGWADRFTEWLQNSVFD